MTPEEFKNLLADLVAQAYLDQEDGLEDYSDKTQELFDTAVREYERECLR